MVFDTDLGVPLVFFYKMTFQLIYLQGVGDFPCTRNQHVLNDQVLCCSHYNECKPNNMEGGHNKLFNNDAPTIN